MKILTLDAGGIKGIYQITIISELEKNRGYNFNKSFDIFSGTSIGGIIAIFLAFGIDLSGLIDKFYKSIIAKENISNDFFNWIAEIFENKYFGEISSKVFLPVYDFTTGNRCHFGIKSSLNCDEVSIPDIIRAISADYRVMNPYDIKPLSRNFIDAGFFAYDPLMYFLRNLKKTELKCEVLSIGSGYIKNINDELNKDEYFDLMYDTTIYEQFLNNEFILNILENKALSYYRISEDANMSSSISAEQLYMLALNKVKSISNQKLNIFFNENY